MVTAIRDTDLVPGKKYQVEFDDCCVRGSFIATFEAYVDNDPLMDELVFDTARIEPGGFTFTEVEP